MFPSHDRGGGSTEGGAGGAGPKRQDQVVKFKQTPSAKKAGEQASKEAQGASSQIDPSQRVFASRKRGESGAIPFKQFTGQSPKGSAANPEISGIDFDNEVTAKEANPKTKKQKPTITRGRARKNKGFDQNATTSPSFEISGRTKRTGEPQLPKFTKTDNPSFLAKSVEKVKQFAKDEPVAALATYDFGKGILGKILKVKSFAQDRDWETLVKMMDYRFL